jgi:hypothetical protein
MMMMKAFVISNVVHNRSSVKSDTLMPSTGRTGHLKPEIEATATVLMTFTFIDVWTAGAGWRLVAAPRYDGDGPFCGLRQYSPFWFDGPN